MDKKVWQSKTMWLNLIMGLATAVAGFWPQANAVTAWLNSNMAVVGMVWGVAGMLLRWVTKDAVILID